MRHLARRCSTHIPAKLPLLQPRRLIPYLQTFLPTTIMSNPSLIVTHPGAAHKDEFLACAFLITQYGVPIARREPTQSDLAKTDTIVVDVGGSHDPALLNFDHHQFPADHPRSALFLSSCNISTSTKRPASFATGSNPPSTSTPAVPSKPPNGSASHAKPLPNSTLPSTAPSCAPSPAKNFSILATFFGN